MELGGGITSSRSTVGSNTPGGGPVEEDGDTNPPEADGNTAEADDLDGVATAAVGADGVLSSGGLTACPLAAPVRASLGHPVIRHIPLKLSLNRSISTFIFDSIVDELTPAPPPATISDVAPGATDIERSRFLRLRIRAAACLDPAERLLHRLILFTDITSNRSLVQLFLRLRFEQTDLAGDGFGIEPSAIRANRSTDPAPPPPPPMDNANDELDF
uniref:Uncharacterized protein n=1 Tax=Anopheles farauti TaxID=69004 RepID=A0A182Q679_9DIPT